MRNSLNNIICLTLLRNEAKIYQSFHKFYISIFKICINGIITIFSIDSPYYSNKC